MNIDKVQKSRLFQSFLTEQLIWNSDYLTYIRTNNHCVTSKTHNVTKIFPKFYQTGNFFIFSVPQSHNNALSLM